MGLSGEKAFVSGLWEQCIFVDLQYTHYVNGKNLNVAALEFRQMESGVSENLGTKRTLLSRLTLLSGTSDWTLRSWSTQGAR